MANTANKNTMLPTYEGRYSDMIGALKVGDISSPCWFYLNDKDSLVFIHWEKTDVGKVLVPHTMLLKRMEAVEETLKGLINPDTGEAISVTTYVSETVVPVQDKVRTVTNDVEEIKKTGAAIMLTSEDTSGGDE